MNEVREALAELAGKNKTKRSIQRSAADTATYLEEQLKQQPGDTITLPRYMAAGVKSVLRSASKDHVEVAHG